MEEIKKQADELLEEIGLYTNTLQKVDMQLSVELAGVANRYRDSRDKLKAILKTKNSQLKRLMKKHKKGLFIDTAQASVSGPVKAIESVRINLKHGALLYALEKRVKQAKGMLGRLKKHGYGKTNAVKIAESVNWDELEKWPDEKLKKVGTERIEKERFAYEVTK